MIPNRPDCVPQHSRSRPVPLPERRRTSQHQTVRRRRASRRRSPTSGPGPNGILNVRLLRVRRTRTIAVRSVQGVRRHRRAGDLSASGKVQRSSKFKVEPCKLVRPGPVCLLRFKTIQLSFENRQGNLMGHIRPVSTIVGSKRNPGPIAGHCNFFCV